MASFVWQNRGRRAVEFFLSPNRSNVSDEGVAEAVDNEKGKLVKRF